MTHMFYRFVHQYATGILLMIYDDAYNYLTGASTIHFYIISYYVMSCHVMSRNVTSHRPSHIAHSTSHSIPSHHITLCNIISHYIILHCITLHSIPLCNIISHYIILHCITLHSIPFHYITLHYIIWLIWWQIERCNVMQGYRTTYSIGYFRSMYVFISSYCSKLRHFLTKLHMVIWPRSTLA